MECFAYSCSVLPVPALPSLSFIYSANGYGVSGRESWDKSGFIHVLIPIKGQDSHLQLPLCVCPRQRYLGHAPVIPDRNGDMAWIWIPAGIWILLALMETVGKSQQHLGNAEFPRNLGCRQGFPKGEHREDFGDEEKFQQQKSHESEWGLNPFQSFPEMPHLEATESTVGGKRGRDGSLDA